MSVDRTPCTTKHDNPYCATSEPKILVDVEHERSRIGILTGVLKAHGFRDNGTDTRRRQRQATRNAIADSQDRIRAVEMGCALPEPKTPCPEAFFVDGTCENCGAAFAEHVDAGGNAPYRETQL